MVRILTSMLLKISKWTINRIESVKYALRRGIHRN